MVKLYYISKFKYIYIFNNYFLFDDKDYFYFGFSLLITYIKNLMEILQCVLYKNNHSPR